MGRRIKAFHALEECLQDLGNQDDDCLIKFDYTLASGMLPKARFADMKYVLLRNCNFDAKRLACQSLVNSLKQIQRPLWQLIF
jgi:hypothetical protein